MGKFIVDIGQLSSQANHKGPPSGGQDFKKCRGVGKGNFKGKK